MARRRQQRRQVLGPHDLAQGRRHARRAGQVDVLRQVAQQDRCRLPQTQPARQPDQQPPPVGGEGVGFPGGQRRFASLVCRRARLR
ncbi:MAG: hypothetical protein ACE5JG_09820, partial [Planctomycetota bacterium]